LIQTNADIQPGDSGGPLVNTAGQAIAIDTAASSSFSFSAAQTQGFAIPVNTAMSLARQIENHDASATVHIGPTAFLGVEFQPGEGQGGFGLGGQSGSSSGATLAGVISGTPAAQAGLAAGDTIVAVDGQSVDSPTALTTLLDRYQPGDHVQIGWTDQSGAQHSSTVQLASGPAH
jgi:S1-C subfamily serine protease